MQQSGAAGSRGCALFPLLSVLFFQALTRRKKMRAWEGFVSVVLSAWIQTMKRHIDESLRGIRRIT
uniref:Myelin protein zero like 3 n=1 Tax=Microcebus murinus TaxID=30608 RepID=A0A8C5W400_MICMU